MRSKVIVIGGGGHAGVIIDILRCCGHQLVGVYDDYKIEKYPWLGKITDIVDDSQYNYVCALGDNKLRKKVVAEHSNLNWISLIHPTAYVSNSVVIGIDTIVCAGAIIQSNTTIGNHCIINTNSSVDHDCIVEDYVHICPGCTICGGVKIENSSFIGAGSTIINGIKVGQNVLLGAGSLVIRDINDNKKAFGSPAKEFSY